MTRNTKALLVAASIIASGALASHASADGERYITVAWQVPLTSSEWNAAGRTTGRAIWPQQYEAHVGTGAVIDLDALDGTVTACGVYQVDAYPEDGGLGLVAAGTLNYRDDYGLNRGWKFIDNGDCSPIPASTPNPPPVVEDEPTPAPTVAPTPEPTPVVKLIPPPAVVTPVPTPTAPEPTPTATATSTPVVTPEAPVPARTGHGTYSEDEVEGQRRFGYGLGAVAGVLLGVAIFRGARRAGL